MTDTDTLSAVLRRLARLPAGEAADAARADQDARWQAGEAPPAEAYLDRLPAVAADPEQALVLIYGEVLARAARGEAPDPAAYAARFPHLADRLAMQFAVHDALNAALPATAAGVAASAGGSAGPTLDAGAVADTPAAAVPDRVGGYEITGELGRGGMGLVLAARDAALGREVAIKTLIPGRPAGPEVVARFVREARITARLPHPAVPPVHALGELPGGAPYLAMKLIRGRTLDGLLGDRPDPAHDLPRLIQAFEQVCQAVGYAHAHRVVHRDLKPGNVMVGEFGEVQVMDWGLAKVLPAPGAEPDDDPDDGDPAATATYAPAAEARAPGADSDDATRVGSVLGTPAYMAPEQARGEPVDARADVFALGAVLAEVLTGGPAFSGSGAQAVLKKAAAGDVGEVRTRLGACGADADLAALATRCLSPLPADRPADGGEVAAAVAAYRTGVEDRLRAAERDKAAAVVREEEGRRRRRWRRAAVGAAVVLVAGGVGFAWRDDNREQRRRAEAAEQDAEVARVEGERQREAAEAEKRAAAIAADARAKEAAADAERKAARERVNEAVGAILRRTAAALADGDAEEAADRLAEAEKRAAEPGAEAHRPTLARYKRDVAMLRAMDRIDADFLEDFDKGGQAGRDSFARAVRVFADYGLVLGWTTPEAAAKVFAESAIGDTLFCIVCRGYSMMPTEAFGRYLTAFDPDPYREEVRAVIRRKDAAAARRLLARPEARTPPAHFVHMVASCSGLPEDLRRDVLLAAFHRGPNDFRLLFGLGLYVKNPAEQVGWLRAAVAVRPRSAIGWNQLGRTLKRLGRLAEAVDAFGRATGLAADSAIYRLDLGVARRLNGDPAGAVEALERAASLDPKNAEVVYQLGLAWLDRRDFDRALAHFRKTVALAPLYDGAHYHAGRALDAKGDPAGAVAAYRAAVRTNPDHADAHYWLGRAADARREPNNAETEYREAVRANPHYAAAHSRLARLLERRGDLNGAVRHYTQAAEIAPANALYKRDRDAAAGRLAGRVAPPPRPTGR